MSGMVTFDISPELSHELASLRGKLHNTIVEGQLERPEDLVESMLNIMNGENLAKLAIAMAMSSAIVQKVVEQKLGPHPSGMVFTDMVTLGMPIYAAIVQEYFDKAKKQSA